MTWATVFHFFLLKQKNKWLKELPQLIYVGQAKMYRYSLTSVYYHGNDNCHGQLSNSTCNYLKESNIKNEKQINCNYNQNVCSEFAFQIRSSIVEYIFHLRIRFNNVRECFSQPTKVAKKLVRSLPDCDWIKLSNDIVKLSKKEHLISVVIR